MITPTPEFWKVFKKTPGALSCAEALAIMNIVSELPENSICLELGTHKGKSAISAITQFKNNTSFTLVDPEFVNKDFWDETIKTVSKTLNKSVFIVIIKNAGYSVDAIQLFDKINYVFVDSGSHGDGLPMQEVKLLEDKMVQGGIIAFHDYKNQFVEVEQAYNYLVSTGKYEPIHINWQEIFDYVAQHNLEEGNNSWHQYPELPHPPNFIGALRKK